MANKQKLLASAQKHIQRGSYAKAAQDYAQALAEDPSDLRVMLKLGEVQQKNDNVIGAVETYSRVAHQYTGTGFLLKAAAVYKRILTIDPENVIVHVRLAEVYQHLGLLSDAMSYYYAVANILQKKGDVAGYKDVLGRMTAIEPENIGIRIKLAEHHSRTGDIDSAVEEFKTAAHLLRRNDRLDDYIKVAERLIYHKPDAVDQIRELVSVYLERGENRRALAKIQLCTRQDPRDTDTLELLTQTFVALEQSEKACQVLREKARIHTQHEQMDEARDCWRRLLEINPNDQKARDKLNLNQPQAPPPAHNPLAPVQTARVQNAAYGSESDFDARAGEIKRLLTETDVYIKYGLQDRAFEHLRKVFLMDPNNLDAMERIKEMHFQAGYYPQAVAELLRMAKLAFHSDSSRAVAYLREAIELIPDHEGALNLAAQYGLTREQLFPVVDNLNPEELPGADSVDDMLAQLTADLDDDDEPAQHPSDAPDLQAQPHRAAPPQHIATQQDFVAPAHLVEEAPMPAAYDEVNHQGGDDGGAPDDPDDVDAQFLSEDGPIAFDDDDLDDDYINVLTSEGMDPITADAVGLITEELDPNIALQSADDDARRAQTQGLHSAVRDNAPKDDVVIDVDALNHAEEVGAPVPQKPTVEDMDPIHFDDDVLEMDVDDELQIELEELDSDAVDIESIAEFEVADDNNLEVGYSFTDEDLANLSRSLGLDEDDESEDESDDLVDKNQPLMEDLFLDNQPENTAQPPSQTFSAPDDGPPAHSDSVQRQVRESGEQDMVTPATSPTTSRSLEPRRTLLSSPRKTGNPPGPTSSSPRAIVRRPLSKYANHFRQEVATATYTPASTRGTITDADLDAPQHNEDTHEATMMIDVHEMQRRMSAHINRAPTSPEPAQNHPRDDDAGADALQQDLQKVDLYVQQGRTDDAVKLLKALDQRHPGSAPVLQRLDRMTSHDAPMASAPANPPQNHGEVPPPRFVAEPPALAMPVLDDQPAVDAAGGGQLNSHFELGLAYREMGLYEDSILEFQMAFDDQEQLAEALFLMAQSHFDMGQMSEAALRFKEALNVQGLQEALQAHTVYRLALASEAAGELVEALHYYKLVAPRADLFPDIGQRLSLLEQRRGQRT